MAFIDTASFASSYLSSDPDRDMNGDGIVNFVDYAVFVGYFLQPPGPSGLAPVCMPGQLSR